MPKPFFFIRFKRNFTGVGSVFSDPSVPYDRRVDWVSGSVFDPNILVPSGSLTIGSDPAGLIYTFIPQSGSLTIAPDQVELVQTLAGQSGSLTIGSDPAGLLYALSVPGGSLTIGSDPSTVIQNLAAASGSLTIASDIANLQTNLAAASGSLTIGSDIAELQQLLAAASGSLTIGSDPAGVQASILAGGGSLTIGSDAAGLIYSLLATSGSLTISSDAPTVLGLDVPIGAILPDELSIIGGDVFVTSASTPFPDSYSVQPGFLTTLGGNVAVITTTPNIQAQDGSGGLLVAQGGQGELYFVTTELITAGQSTIYSAGNQAIIQPEISPWDVEGLIGWWDADDDTTIRGNGDVAVTRGTQSSVQYWYDKASGIRLDQLSGPNQPIWWTDRLIGGKPTLKFDGSVDNMSTTTIPAHWDDLDEMTICYMVDPTGINNIGTSGVIFGYETTGGGGGRIARADIQQDGLSPVNNVGTVQSPSTIDATGRPNWAILDSEVASNYSAGLFNDNTSAGAGSGSSYTPSAADTVSVGAYNNLFNFKGHVAEILVYNRRITFAEKRRIGAYFDRKWGRGFAAPDDYIVGFNEITDKWQDTARLTPADADGDSVRSIQNDGSLGGYFEYQAGGVPTLEITDGASAMKQAAITQATQGYFSLPDADALTPKSGQGFEIFVAFSTTTTDDNIGPIGKWEDSPTTEREWYMITQSSTTDFSTSSGVRGATGTSTGSALDNMYDVRDGGEYVSHLRFGVDDYIQMGLDGEFLGTRNLVTEFPSDPSGTTQELILFAYDDNYTFTGFTGSIRAVRIYDRELTDEERASVILEMNR